MTQSVDGRFRTELSHCRRRSNDLAETDFVFIQWSHDADRVMLHALRRVVRPNRLRGIQSAAVLAAPPVREVKLAVVVGRDSFILQSNGDVTGK